MVNINGQSHIFKMLSQIIWEGHLVFDHKIFGVTSVLHDGYGHHQVGEIMLHPFLTRTESTFILTGIYTMIR